jgi:tetratricopeptide (TPR) repeat protein
VTGSDDKTARLWNLRLDELVELGCRTAGRNLTGKEWKQYMGDELYHKTCSKLPIHLSVIEEARDTARRGDIKSAVTQFKRILEIEPNLTLKPEEEARKVYATYVLQEGKSLAEKGKIKEAIANYDKISQIDPSLNIDFESWNLLCWHGALSGFAKDVIGACDSAVRLAPDAVIGENRNSRGLARALTGNYAGAIEDFKAYVEWSKANNLYEKYGQKREGWINSLEAGKNPFDEAPLEALRHE